MKSSYHYFRELEINNLPSPRVYFAPLPRCENPHYTLHNSCFRALQGTKIIPLSLGILFYSNSLKRHLKEFTRFFYHLGKLSLLFSLLCLPIWLSAHGSIHEKIAHISKKIQKNPNKPELYLKRSTYYRIDQDFDLAYKDLLHVQMNHPEVELVDFHLANLFSEFKFPQTALLYINRFLEKKPENTDALIIRASIFIQLKKEEAAVRDFTKAIHLQIKPKPDYYVEIARAVIRGDSANFGEAVRWLEEGETVFGFNIVLSTEKIDILEGGRQFDAAILQINQVISQLPRHEKWLFRKAGLLEKAERPAEAYENYQKAEKAIQQLPKSRRASRAVMEMEGKIAIRLIALKETLKD